MHDYPGSYQLIQHFPEGSLQREIEFEVGFVKGRVIEIITSEKLKDMKVRFLRNRFYRRYFFKTQTYLNAVAPVQTLLGAPLRTQNTTGLIAEFTIDSGSSGLYKLIY